MDVERYLRHAGRGFRTSGRDHMVGTCWCCGKRDHLYVNTRTGLWKCFAGRCEATGNLVSAVMTLEAVDEVEAHRIIAQHTLPRIPELTAELRAKLVPEDDTPERIDTPLPSEYRRFERGDVLPAYLREREVDYRTARRFRLGFCSAGRYADRIVMPIRSPYGRSFTTRFVRPGEPRYLGGEGSGRLLYGWDVLMRVHTNPRFVCVVEGPFDALRVHQAGLPVVAIMGKVLRAPQRKQLRVLDTRYVVLFDAETDAEAVDCAAMLDGLVARLPGTKDPGASSVEVIRQTVADAVERSQARAGLLRKRLLDTVSEL